MSANALRVAAIGAEIAILGATATVAGGLVADSGNIRIVAPMIVAATAVEACRLPLVLRAPKLGFASAVCAMALAAVLSIVTMETMVLGFEGLLHARGLKVAAAETRLTQAQTSFAAAEAAMSRWGEEIDRLGAEVAAAQKHSEEVGRESVALQNNPTVSAYRGRRGWTAPGGAAANTAANANARAQAEHASRSIAAETDLAAARASLAALKPVDVKAEEADLVTAKLLVERERAASPVHRLAASLFRVDVGSLSASQYETVRRAATISLGVIVSIGTLIAGLISSLPERGSQPRKLSRALRRMIAARRKTLRRINDQTRVEYRDRPRFIYVPTDAEGRVLNPDTRR